MPTPLTITVPHNLSRAEALARVRANQPKVTEQAKPFVSSIEEHWEGDQLHVAVKALGQDFTGRVDVLDKAVEIQVQMPAMFGWLGGRLQKVLTKQAPRLLTKGKA